MYNITIVENIDLEILNLINTDFLLARNYKKWGMLYKNQYAYIPINELSNNHLRNIIIYISSAKSLSYIDLLDIKILNAIYTYVKCYTYNVSLFDIINMIYKYLLENYRKSRYQEKLREISIELGTMFKSADKGENFDFLLVNEYLMRKKLDINIPEYDNVEKYLEKKISDGKIIF